MKITREELNKRFKNHIRKEDNHPPHLHCIKCLEDFVCSNCNNPFEGICTSLECKITDDKGKLLNANFIKKMID